MKARYIGIVLAVTILLIPIVLSAAPQEKETVLHILQPCEPPPPLRTWNIFYRCRPTAMILEPLFWYSRGERKWYPWLAEGFTEKITDKYIIITIKLRKGIKWSDGTDFTALDVLTSYWIRGWILKWWPIQKYVDYIEAPDKYTVVIYVKRPAPIFYKWWYLRQWTPVPFSQYGRFAPGLTIPGRIPLKDVDTEELAKKLREYRPDKLVGTGPYEYERFTSTEWVYRRRPDYWVEKLGVTWKLETPKGTFEFGGGVPGYRLFDKIIWHRRISDPASWPLIMAGKFDYTWTGLSETCYETVKKKPGYWAPTGPWLHGHALYFNCKKFPLKVRWAIAYAIDLKEYCSVAVEWGPESVVPAEWPVAISPADVYTWLPKDWLKKWINKYEYNPEMAEKLLKEAGYTKKNGWWYTPEGKKFTLTVHVPAGWAGWVPGAENIAFQLRRFGIDAKVIQLDWGMWGDTIRVKGEFDLAIEFWTYGLYHPWDSYNRFYISYTLLGKGFHFDPIVEVPEGVSKYSGKVNASELTEKLAITLDIEEQKELVKALAYITNYYLPALQLHEKKWANTVCIDHIDCAVDWSVFMWYTPIQIEMGNNPGFVYGFLLCSGLWRPKVVAPPAPAVPIEEIVRRVAEVIPIEEVAKAIERMGKELSEAITPIKESAEAAKSAAEAAKSSAEAAKNIAGTAVTAAYTAAAISIVTLIVVIVLGIYLLREIRALRK